MQVVVAFAILTLHLPLLFISVRAGQASQAVSSWDLPSQTTLKFRQTGQSSEAELRKRDVRAEVEESERRALDSKPIGNGRRYGKSFSRYSTSNLNSGLSWPSIAYFVFALMEFTSETGDDVHVHIQ